MIPKDQKEASVVEAFPFQFFWADTTMPKLKTKKSLSKRMKFTKTGRHLLTIGAPNVVGSDADTRHLNRPANMVVDSQTNELFVADGYGNHRVIVVDAGTGAYKRHWGANGRPPGDVYTTEVDSVKRVQKFMNKGPGP